MSWRLSSHFPFFAREADQAFDPVAEATALIENKHVVGHEEAGPYQDFVLKAADVPTGDFWRTIHAFRLLTQAGSEASRDIRREILALRMGEIFYTREQYLPALIEFSSAYIYGQQDIYSRIANTMEKGGRQSHDLLHASRTLQRIPSGEAGGIDLAACLRAYHLPEAIVGETVQLWNENPEIGDAIRGDLVMYRAMVASRKSQTFEERQRVLQLYKEARAAGLAVLDADTSFEIINARRMPDRHP